MAAALPIQHFANGLAKAVEDDPSTCVPATQAGDHEEAPGSWIWHDQALADATIWGSETAGGRSLPLSLLINK